MMQKPNSLPKPTDAELGLLHILWQRGPSTVREVHEAMLQRDRPMGYTTVLKLLQIMTEKGLVKREESGRAHVYSPTQSEEHAQRRYLGELVERVFGGSAQKLVMQALTSQQATPTELAEIRKLLDELEGKNA